jgi:hypothetical protein
MQPVELVVLLLQATVQTVQLILVTAVQVETKTPAQPTTTAATAALE